MCTFKLSVSSSHQEHILGKVIFFRNSWTLLNWLHKDTDWFAHFPRRTRQFRVPMLITEAQYLNRFIHCEINFYFANLNNTDCINLNAIDQLYGSYRNRHIFIRFNILNVIVCTNARFINLWYRKNFSQ